VSHGHSRRTGSGRFAASISPCTLHPVSQHAPPAPCPGVQLVLDDPHAFRPLRTALTVLTTLVRLYPRKVSFRGEALLRARVGTLAVLDAVRRGADAATIEASGAQATSRFSFLRPAAARSSDRNSCRRACFAVRRFCGS